MRPRVFDASALIALHRGHPPVFAAVVKAQAGDAAMVIPVTALAAANTVVRKAAGEWEDILVKAGFEVLPLPEHTAIEMGSWPGSVDVRHVVYEARALRGVVVTCEPGEYKGHEVPLWVM